jgi:SAM-dependent methyltransferase
MVLARLADYYARLICPRCSRPVTIHAHGARCSNYQCEYATASFPLIEERPALFDFATSIGAAESLSATKGAAQIKRRGFLPILRHRLSSLLHPPNRRAQTTIRKILGLLRQGAAARSDRPTILVIGGGTIGSGVEDLYTAPDVDVLAFDIYSSETVQFLADAHRIPLADSSADAVVVQAVLEHVLEPHVVAQEIHRVLRTGGLVYADTPFLQHVHEGPYDFIRFTDSGHRYLFRGFERIESGVIAGAATQLTWALDYFFRALFRSRAAGLVVRLSFSWLPRLDRFLDPRYSLDAASSVYFFGRRSEETMPPQGIVGYYQGAQR